MTFWAVAALWSMRSNPWPELTITFAVSISRITALGMDTPTPGTDWVPIHKALLKPGVDTVIVEALAHLDQCPEEFVFVGFPLLLKGRDGSPIRAAAIVE